MMKEEKNILAVKMNLIPWFGRQGTAITVMVLITTVSIVVVMIKLIFIGVQGQCQLMSCTLSRISQIGEYLTELYGQMANQGYTNLIALQKHLTC